MKFSEGEEIDTPLIEHASMELARSCGIEAAGVFPMLPEALSNDLTSLHEGQERLAVVVDMQVEADGTASASASASSVYRATVFNHAKLTYDGVSAWLDCQGPPPAQIASVPVRYGNGARRAARSMSTRCPPARCLRTGSWWTCAPTTKTAPRT